MSSCLEDTLEVEILASPVKTVEMVLMYLLHGDESVIVVEGRFPIPKRICAQAGRAVRRWNVSCLKNSVLLLD
jgi:hypothetical protein